ncbi:hypothetical protein ACFQ4O_01750 [Methylopila musalis]|uniref:Uncharacterized protein n=1 Tax=Methylopila musalis TaxID=1134781 RepID=A0ABW3Z381_9HYPH
MTLEEIDAQILALEAAKRARLIGGQATDVSYGGQIAAKLAVATLTEVEQELVRLRMLRARLAGEPSPVRPVVAGFGPR